MKEIPCSYSRCGEMRQHFGTPYKNSPHRMIKVEDDYEGPCYCSIECAVYAGHIKSLRFEEDDSSSRKQSDSKE